MSGVKIRTGDILPSNIMVVAALLYRHWHIECFLSEEAAHITGYTAFRSIVNIYATSRLVSVLDFRVWHLTTVMHSYVSLSLRSLE